MNAPEPNDLVGASAIRVIWLLLGGIAVLVAAVTALAVTVAVVATDSSTSGGYQQPGIIGAAPQEPMIPLPPPAATEIITDSSEHTVVYTNEGFSPPTLDVAAGDSVRFVNSSDWDFWPASNIHPTHEVLPGFDPLGPVGVGEAWAHTFDKVGVWYFHDHLNPIQGGKIVVVAALAEPSSPPDDESAAQPPPAEADLGPLVLEMPDREFAVAPDDAASRHSDIYIDDRKLESFVEQYGPAAALGVLKQIEIDTNGYCHDRAHEVGRMAYEVFGPAAFVLSTHDCRSGGQHGAIEALFAERGTTRLAEDIRTLCTTASNSFTRHQCLHGIGHGLMAWTNYALLEALDLCDLAPTRQGQGSCYGGVYMENVVGGLSGDMGHFTEYLRYDDPVFPCDIVAARHQPDCYLFQTSHMMAVLSWDIPAVADLCAEAPISSQILCFSSIGRDVNTHANLDPAESIRHCKHTAAFGESPYEACIGGAVQNGFWEVYGGQRSADFCALVDADADSSQRVSDTCYRTIINRARDLFPTPSDLSAWCSLLPASRQASCTA